jgi:Flp pilus assembly protein TadD
MSPRKKGKNSRRYLQHIMLIAALCTILSSTVVFIQYVYPVLKERYKKERWSVTYRHAVAENEALILISEFENFGTHKFNISGRILETLQKELSVFPDVKIYLYPAAIPIEDPAKAATIGWKYNALMLIWGTYDDAGIRPLFAFPRTLPVEWEGVSPSIPDLDSRLARTIHLCDLSSDSSSAQEMKCKVFEDFPADSSMSKYVSGALPKQMVYLTTLALGIRYFNMGKTDKSLQAFEKCIAVSKLASMNFGLSEAYGYRAKIHISKSEFQAALSDLKKAVAIDSGNISALLYRAYLYLMQNEVMLADMDLDAVLGRIPDSFLSNFFEQKDLALLYRISGILQTEFSRSDAAVHSLEKYIQTSSERDPKASALAYTELGLIHKNRKEYEEAEKAFSKAVAFDSTAASPYYWLGAFSVEMHRDTAKSCYYFNKYLALEEDSTAAFLAKKKIKPFCRDGD